MAIKYKWNCPECGHQMVEDAPPPFDCDGCDYITGESEVHVSEVYVDDDELRKGNAEIARLREAIGTATSELDRLIKMFSLPNSEGEPDRAAVGLLQHAHDNITAALDGDSKPGEPIHTAPTMIKQPLITDEYMEKMKQPKGEEVE